MMILILVMDTTAEGGEVYILYTHNCNGYIASCNCPSHPYGGITRRATFIKNFRKKHKNVIIVSTGDEFGILKYSIRDKYILKALMNLKYDLFLPGDQELSYPPSFFKKYKRDLTFLMLNLESKEKIFKKYKIIKRGGIKFLFTGIMGKDPSLLIDEKYKYKEYKKALKELIKKYRKEVDTVVLLSHSGEEEDKRIAKEIEGIDIIIGAHTQSLIEPHLKVNHCIIVQAGDNCQYIGIIKVAKMSKNIKISTKVERLEKELKEDKEILNLISQMEEEFNKKASGALIEK